MPQWAVAPVLAMGPDHRRLEGLIAPGTWNVDPSAQPRDMLGALIAAGGEVYEQNGLLNTATSLNMTPTRC